jgi:hypothetical protein
MEKMFQNLQHKARHYLCRFYSQAIQRILPAHGCRTNLMRILKKCTHKRYTKLKNINSSLYRPISLWYDKQETGESHSLLTYIRLYETWNPHILPPFGVVYDGNYICFRCTVFFMLIVFTHFTYLIYKVRLYIIKLFQRLSKCNHFC